MLKRSAVILGTLLISLTSMLAYQNAAATPVTWYMQNVTLSDGEAVTGSFVLDVDKGALISVSIATSGGIGWTSTECSKYSAASGSIDLVTATVAPYEISQGGGCSFAAPEGSPPVVVYTLVISGQRPFTDAGGTIAINNTLYIVARNGSLPSSLSVVSGDVTASSSSQISVATSLPTGEVGVAYPPPSQSAQLISGGVPPYSVSVSGLPTGLSVNSDGTVSGTPATGATGSHVVTVSATDGAGDSGGPSTVQLAILPSIVGTWYGTFQDDTYSASGAAQWVVQSESTQGAITGTFAWSWPEGCAPSQSPCTYTWTGTVDSTGAINYTGQGGYVYAAHLSPDGSIVAGTFNAPPPLPTDYGTWSVTRSGPCSVKPAMVSTLAGGVPSADGKPTAMLATFSPLSTTGVPTSLADAAVACGVSEFDWTQTVTHDLPFQDANGVALIPPYADPPPGSYSYILQDPGTYSMFLNAYPFYYNYKVVPTGCASVNNTAQAQCVYISSNAQETLNFYDSPRNSQFAAGDYIAFTTQLVGVNGDGSLGPSFYEWTWSSTYNQKTGGVTTASSEPADGSGTGGVTITSINGVQQTPPTATSNATPNLLWPPEGEPISVVVTGNAVAGTSSLASASYSVADSEGLVQPSGAISLGAGGNYSFSIPLIASRPNGAGRTYSIRVTVTDGIGNVASSLSTVVVPAPPSIPGDLNGDGLVNCADLAIIKAAFGKKVGQVGFDFRADVNGDGVVNILDLSAEAKLMPAGTVCQ
jgi:hypothetical protein